MQSITERLEYFKEELERLKTEAVNMTDVIQTLENFLDAASHISERLDTMTEEERIETVRLLVERVTINEQGVYVTMILDFTGEIIPCTER